MTLAKLPNDYTSFGGFSSLLPLIYYIYISQMTLNFFIRIRLSTTEFWIYGINNVFSGFFLHQHRIAPHSRVNTRFCTYNLMTNDVLPEKKLEIPKRPFSSTLVFFPFVEHGQQLNVITIQIVAISCLLLRVSRQFPFTFYFGFVYKSI